MKTPPVSAFIVCRDAARLLPAAVANLRRFAAEVLVVVDTASIDASAAVAQQVADRVECWPVGGSYESVLNEAAALCRHDWILFSHDDELWPPAFVTTLPGLLASGLEEVLFSRRHVINAAGDWITSAPWWPDQQLRLRSRAAWQARPWPRLVHHSPPSAGTIWAHTSIWHLKFLVKSAAERVSRLATWTTHWATAGTPHYRAFSLPEEFTYQVGPADEIAPAEFAAMLAAAGEEAA